MNKSKNIETIVSSIVELGHSINDTCLDHLVVSEFAKYEWINREHHSFWHKVANNLDSEDLEALIKALTILETKLNWLGGSVSSVIWTFKAFQLREKEKSNNLGDWILNHTRNPYVPFGSYNFHASSIKDYNNKIESYESRRESARLLKYEQELREKEKLIEFKEAKQLRRQEIRKSRQEYMICFNKKTLLEQLIIIAHDQEHPIDYFPLECATNDCNVLIQLCAEDREALITRLISRRKGPWLKTYQALLKYP